MVPLSAHYLEALPPPLSSSPTRNSKRPSKISWQTTNQFFESHLTRQQQRDPTPVQLVDKMPVQIQLLLVLHSLKVECWRIKAKKTSTDPAVIFEEISIGSRRCLDQTVVVEDGGDVDNVHTAASIPSHHPHDHRFESTPSQNNNRNNTDAHLTNNWHSHLIIDSGLFFFL
ncbi:hypothetical protein Pst134EB_010681 [Puccinia striiformis f. sp. tritici]|nr:hypothetical protein Pst134EB_010681 [Puccinia striiformis f. sp. tritici]